VRRRDVALNIDRPLRVVAYALLGLTALALVMLVRFAIAFLDHAFVPPERRYGTRAVALAPFLTTALVTTCLVSR
jgi:hypothetical protein